MKMNRELGSKAGVLVIALIFISGAFVPVVGLQVESVATSPSSENEKIKLGAEESLGSSGYITESKDTDYSALNVLFGTLLGMVNIVVNNPIFSVVCELFTGKDTHDDTKDIDHDVNQIVNDLLNNEKQTDTLNQPLVQPSDNLGPMPLGAGDPWWNSDWQYRKLIVVDHEQVDANSDLNNFPVLINITDSDLCGHAQFDGDDIVFTDYSGTQLNHEIEFFNGNTGELVCWVNVTTLSGDEDTKLYLYYGNSGCDNQENPQGVWDSHYKMVQHLPHNWIPYPSQGNYVFGGGTFASIFKVDDTYHMYYHGGGVGHATSSNGKTWVADTVHNPVLSPTAGVESAVGVPFAWKEGSTWYMLYRGQYLSDGEAAGLATSSDGVNWVKHPSNPVLTGGESGQWDAGGAEIWGTMKVDDTYYTYYEVYYSGSRHIGIATSTDLVNWTKDPNNPIMGGLGPYDTGVGRFCPDIFRYGDYYYMLVPHYMSGTNWARIELYRDTNPTFYPGEREYLGPVKPCSHTGFDSHDQDTPCVLTDSIHRDSFATSSGELWTYHDGEAAGRQVGLLISPSIPQALKGAMRDSTIFGNHGDSGGVGGPVPQFSIIGGGCNFDSDEYMVVSDSSSLDISDDVTMETWVRLDTALSSQPNDYSGIISKKESGSGYGLWFNCIGEMLVVSVGMVNVGVDVSSVDWTEWHHILGVYDGSMVRVHIDSSLVHSEAVSGAIGTNDVDLWIGDLVHQSGNNLVGSVDEVRISNTVRNTGWINTSFLNQNNPSGFYSVGAEETGPLPDEPVLSDENPADGATDVGLNPLLSIYVEDPQGDSVSVMFMTNESGSWQQIGITQNGGNGTYTQATTMFDSYSKKYWWSVNATDPIGSGNWTNETYHFTTEIGEPIISNENPSDGTSNVGLSPVLSVYVVDYQGDLVDVSFRTNASGSWQTIGSNTSVNNETVYCDDTGAMSNYNTKYWWSVNCTDGTHWTNETFSFTTRTAPGAWWDTSWSYRKSITVDHSKVQGNSPLVNFPVLVDIVDSDLAAKAQTSGDDIVFTDKGGNKSHHEIELYDHGSGHLVCWVNITSLSDTSDTTLYMYYENPSCGSQQNPAGVWDSSYVGVWHFNEESGIVYDSTSNDIDCTASGTVLQDRTGKVGRSIYFDGSSDYISCSDKDVLDLTEAFSVTAWVKYASGFSSGVMLTKGNQNSGDPQNYQAGIGSGGSKLRVRVGTTNTDSDDHGYSAGTWYYSAYSFDDTSNNVKFYINGNQHGSDGSNNADLTPNTGVLMIGGGECSGSDWSKGDFDELRLSKVVRSTGWINTSYTMMSSPSTFLSVGSEETVALPDEPVISDEDPTDKATDVGLGPVLSVHVVDHQGDLVDVSFRTNASGSWQTIGSNTSVNNETVYCDNTGAMSSYNTRYWWSVNATDPSGSGNWTNETYWFITMAGGITVDIPLYTGWNLITVPVENTYSAMTLSENITDSVMISRFDAENQTYKTYIVGGPPGFDFPIQDGYGYFVLVSDNSYLNVSGNPITSVSVDLELDWNMIGWYHEYSTTASSLGENITGCIMVSWFDSVSQTFKTFIVGGPPGFDFTITPGMGLFVLVGTTSTWHGEG